MTIIHRWVETLYSDFVLSLYMCASVKLGCALVPMSVLFPWAMRASVRENHPQSLVVFAKASVGHDSITKPSNLRELPLCSEEKCYCSVVALSYRAEKKQCRSAWISIGYDVCCCFCWWTSVVMLFISKNKYSGEAGWLKAWVYTSFSRVFEPFGLRYSGFCFQALKSLAHVLLYTEVCGRPWTLPMMKIMSCGWYMDVDARSIAYFGLKEVFLV